MNSPRTFDLAPGDNIAAVEADCLPASTIARSEWPALIAVFSAGNKTDKERAHSLHAALRSSGRERLENYLEVFCTNSRTPRSSIVTGKIADADPQLALRLGEPEQERGAIAGAGIRSAGTRSQRGADHGRRRGSWSATVRRKERRGLLDGGDLHEQNAHAAP